MITWLAEGGRGMEGVRVLLGGGGLRALGRMVNGGGAGDPPFTASYRLVVDPDGTLRRLAVTSATAGRERHLTLNRTDDGFWLLDRGSGGSRPPFDGVVDVDLAGSALFPAVPVRRLGLHRGPGDHRLPTALVNLPDLAVELVEQRYRAVSPLGEGDAPGTAVVTFSRGDGTADLVVDADGLVVSHPGVAARLPVPAPSTP